MKREMVFGQGGDFKEDVELDYNYVDQSIGTKEISVSYNMDLVSGLERVEVFN